MTQDQKIYPASCHLGGMIMFTAFLANAAVGSGYIGPTETRQKMLNFKSCLAQLEARALEYHNQLTSRTFAPDASFRQISIQALNGGVNITGRRRARYEVKTWYHNGWLGKDGMHYEITHSWNESNYECRGRTMIQITSQGYTQPTFEPIASKAP